MLSLSQVSGTSNFINANTTRAQSTTSPYEALLTINTKGKPAHIFFYSVFSETTKDCFEQSKALEFLSVTAPEIRATLPFFNEMCEEYLQLVAAGIHEVMQSENEQLRTTLFLDLIKSGTNDALNQTTKDRIAQIIQFLNVNKAFHHLQLNDQDLSWQNMEGLDLTSANLAGASLYRTSLANSILIQANLRLASLPYVDLFRANLTGADMTFCTLDSANLRESILTDANLKHTQLNKACMTKATLINANLKCSDLFQVDLEGANLDHANLKKASSKGTSFIEANMSNANLTRTDLYHAELKNANLSNANLKRTKSKDADLTGANMTKVKNLSIHQKWTNFKHHLLGG